MTELPDELRNVREGFLVKLLRATQHLEALEREFETFLKREPYRIVRELEPGRTQYRVQVIEEFPAYLGSIAGDVLQNARSSLDHLAWRLAGENADRWTYFPIYDTRDEYFAQDKRGRPIRTSGVARAAKFPEGARALVEEIQPYHGNEYGRHLGRLNELARIDRHQLLHLVGGASHEVRMRAGRRNAQGELVTTPEGAIGTLDIRVGAFEDGAVIGAFTHPTDVEVECQFSFYIAMRESPHVHFPALPGLAGILYTVKAVIERLAPFLPAHVRQQWAGAPIQIDLGEVLVQPTDPNKPYTLRISSLDEPPKTTE